MKRGLLIVILFAVVVFVGACGGGSEEPASPTTVPASTEEAVRETPAANPVEAKPTDTPKAAQPAEPTAAPEPTQAAAPAVEPEPTLTEAQLEAIEKLDSYRAIVTWTSQGTDAEGNPIDDTLQMTVEYTKEPLARRMTMAIDSSTQPTQTLQSYDMYQIGQDMYMNGGSDVGWIRIQNDESPFSDPSVMLMTDGQIFSNLENFDRVRPDEKINGVDSRHYKFDEQSLGKLIGDASGEVKADGEVWIAKDGGFVTKYLLTIEVKDGNAGSLDPNMVDGTFNMSWELKDVNSKDITIELPAEATAATNLAGFESGFPTPDGATVQASSNTFVIVLTDLPVADATAFYEEALADLGWTKDEGSSGTFGDMTSLTFSKDGTQLSLVIMIDEASGKTQIMANAQSE